MLCLFALAMAWMEAATVLYLRTLVGRLDPYQPIPLPPWSSFEYVELIRELATLLLLAAAAWLAGKDRRHRFGYFLLAFGVWDIFYYVFLVITAGWPRSLADWDVLFLIPVPWWGPVAAPLLIALGLVICGTLMTQIDPQPWPRPWAWVVTLAGGVLALLVFTTDARHAIPLGEAAVRAALPVRFNWPLFVVALALMSAALADMIRQFGGRNEHRRRRAAEALRT